MFCTKCGKKLAPSARFCSGCGSAVADSAAVEENSTEISTPEFPAPAVVEEKAPETGVPEAPAPAVAKEKAPETSAPESPAPAAIEEKAPETGAPEAPAPAAVEEKAPEISAPEAPAPAAVEEKAPETGAPEAPAPAAIEEKAPETGAPESPAPAAIEEKAPETSAPEAPAPAAIEEKAPEISAPEAPAPAAVEEKAPETAGEVPQSPLPAPSFAEFAAENPAPKKKKKKKKLAPIIGGTAAAVVVGGSAVSYFCFHNQTMRLLMGDAGFALSVEKKTGEFFGMTDPAAADEAIAAYLDRMGEQAKLENRGDSDEGLAAFSSLLPMADQLGGSEITYGMSIEADELIYALLLRSEQQTGQMLEALGNFKGILRVSNGENCDRFESVIEYGGERLFGADLYSDGETIAVAAPDLTDYVFFGKLPREEQTEETASFSPEEVGRLRAAITELYYEALLEGEITYADGEFEVAGQTVSGTRIETSLTAEQVGALYASIKETLKNDEKVREYYQTVLDLDGESYEKLFEDGDTVFSSFTAVSYIDGRASLLAKSCLLGVADDADEADGTDGKEEFVSFTLLRAEDEVHFRMETPDGAHYAVDTAEAAAGADGTVEFSYCNLSNGENAPTLVLALDYANVGETRYLGQTVRLGSYTVRVSEKDTLLKSLLTGSSSDHSDYDHVYDETVSELSASAIAADSSAILSEMLRKLSLTLTVSENVGDDGIAAIRSEWSLRMGDYLGISSYYEMRPFEETEPPVMPPLDGEKCLDLNEEQTEETSNRLRIELCENLLKLTEENQAFGKLAGQLGLKERLKSAIEEEREKSEFLSHYADYSDSKLYRANRAAASLAKEFESEFWGDLMTLNEDGSGYLDASEEDAIRTVKLYFDREGEMTVLDNGGFGFLDFGEIEKTDERKSLYCEVIFSSYGKTLPNGVTVVYTDDPEDLPDGLPTVYHYLDEVYEWNGKENARDGFIIGTSPRLSEGVTTAEERIGQEREERERQEREIGALNDAAKKINNAVNGFLSANSGYFRSDVTLASIIVTYDENAGWIVSSFTGNDGRFANQSALFTNGVSAVSQLTDHLNRRFPEFEPITAQIHFVRGDGNFSGMSGPAQNAPTNPGAMSAVGTAAIKNGTGLFQDNNLPDVFDFWTGYCSWTENNPNAVPRAGVYWTDRSEYTLVGTYCKETNAPLADWDQVFSYGEEDYFGGDDSDDPLLARVDALNRDARLLSDTIVGLFGGTSIGEYDEDDDPPLFSLTLSEHDNVWLMTGAYMNNHLYEDSDELIDDDTLAELMRYLNELAESGDLPMSRDVKAQLHFLHNEFVGAAVVPIESNLDFTDHGIPGSWDFHNGFFYEWNARNRNESVLAGIYWLNANTAVPFGSYCVSTKAPLLLTAE